MKEQLYLMLVSTYSPSDDEWYLKSTGYTYTAEAIRNDKEALMGTGNDIFIVPFIPLDKF